MNASRHLTCINKEKLIGSQIRELLFNQNAQTYARDLLTNPTPHIIQHVFVYGTLKPGGRYHSVAQRGGDFTSQDAYIEGFTLYHLEPEGYPAITRGEGNVHGNVFTFENIEQALPFLDELEGLHWTPPEYGRIKTVAYPLEEEVWAYLYLDIERLAQPGAKRLEDGLWRVDLHT